MPPDVDGAFNPCLGRRHSGSAWDSSQTNAFATLSNADMTIASVTNLVGQTRSSIIRNSGQRYFEVYVNAVGPLSVGVATPLWDTGNESIMLGGTPESIGIATNSSTFAGYSATSGGGSDAMGSFGIGSRQAGPGDVIMIAVDFVGGYFYWGVNGLWNNIYDGNWLGHTPSFTTANFYFNPGQPFYAAASVLSAVAS